jgi:hypothetical protein
MAMEARSANCFDDRFLSRGELDFFKAGRTVCLYFRVRWGRLAVIRHDFLNVHG